MCQTTDFNVNDLIVVIFFTIVIGILASKNTELSGIFLGAGWKLKPCECDMFIPHSASVG